MKSKAIVSAITVAALSFGSLSFAQGSYDRRGPGNYEPQRVYDQRGPQQRVDTNYNDRRDNDYGARRFDNNPRGFYDDHRDARNDRNYDARGPQFRRGGYILREYRSNQYVVNDWRGQQLHAPARGQQWVQVGADYALIAIATGVIAQLVLNSR